MTRNQFMSLRNFFRCNPKDILIKQKLDEADIDLPDGKNKEMHNSVIVSESKEGTISYYRIKNSFGQGFADIGYFKIAKNCMKMWFAEVYHVYDELTDQDKERWENATEENKNEFNKKHPQTNEF